MQYLKIYFLFTSAVFRCSSNDIALKGLFLHHCVVFSLFCVAIVISEPFFARAYFRPDFAAIRGPLNISSVTLYLIKGLLYQEMRESAR